ncbi:AAA family ATPase [Nocardia sp. NPDC059240]|uniref:AAA family ATPase n=1 Tax=Nocardia sp. NPDC059240 TaxID=3346786 RepID=UPI00368DEE20
MREPANRPLAHALSADTAKALQQAVDYTPGVTVICGFPASGKTTATTYLAGLLDAVVFDKDHFAPQLEESVMAELTGDRHDRDSDIYARVVAPHLYQALVRTAVTVAERCPVLIDAPFLGYIRAATTSRISLADHIRAVAGAPATAVRTIWLASDPDRIRQRMQARAAERDRSKLADWPAYRDGVLTSGLDRLARTVVDQVVPN